MEAGAGVASGRAPAATQRRHRRPANLPSCELEKEVDGRAARQEQQTLRPAPRSRRLWGGFSQVCRNCSSMGVVKGGAALVLSEDVTGAARVA